MKAQTPTNSRRAAAVATAVLAVLGLLAPAWAADVNARLSANETVVGMPVLLQIAAPSGAQGDAPTLPAIDGVTTELMGVSQSGGHSVVIINGKVVRNDDSTTTNYTYKLTPTREGTFVVPSIEVKGANGLAGKTPAMTFTASKSQDQNLLRVTVVPESKAGYVGQAVKVALQIDVLPYYDKNFNLTLDASDMWSLINDNYCQWGVFEDAYKQMLSQRQRPGDEAVKLKDEQGVEQTYYRYTLHATIWPKRPGQLDVGQVSVVMQYPTGLGRRTDFFGMPGQLGLTGQRPLVASASVDPIDIKPIPEAGRPDTYTGSVGNYVVAMTADSTDVHVGDPIHLLLAVKGDGQMDFLHAPPLGKVDALSKNFQVPDEPLPGYVRDDSKFFSMTIRPKNADVKEIPPIPFSFFNPATAKFETVWTQAVPITVKPVDRLSLDRIVSASGAAKGDVEQTSEKQAEIAWPTIHRGEAVLAEQSAWLGLPGSWGWGVLAAPPVLALLVLSAVGVGRMVHDSSAMKKIETRRAALASLKAAQTPEDVLAAVVGYIAGRCGRSERGMTSHEAVRLLTDAPPEKVSRVRACLDQCEHLRYSGSSDADVDELKQQAHEAIDALDSASLHASHERRQ